MTNHRDKRLGLSKKKKEKEKKIQLKSKVLLTYVVVAKAPTKQYMIRKRTNSFLCFRSTGHSSRIPVQIASNPPNYNFMYTISDEEIITILLCDRTVTDFFFYNHSTL
jgi:hypothetical protein